MIGHPEDEVLAAFVDGTLSGAPRAGVAEHLETCDDCLMVVGESSRYLEEASSAAPPARIAPNRRPERWLAIAATIATFVLVSGWFLRDRWLDRDPVATLAAAARSLPTRPVDARLAGFEYAPYSRTRGANDEIDARTLKVRAIAKRLVADGQRSRDDAKKQHAAGVARLVAGNPAEAVELLQRAIALDPTNATYWSDLAAANYEAAIGGGGTPALRDALAAADRALSIDESLLPARFNRALIVQNLAGETERDRELARYLAADPNSRWADELRQRMTK